MKKIRGFFAYPSQPYQVTVCINAAIKAANTGGQFEFTPWEENDISGRHLVAPIFEGLQKTEILVADITRLNFNVTFEIGFAIGVGKRLFLVRNKEYEPEAELTKRVGIFDTLGYKEYSTDRQLAALITSVTDLVPLDTTAQKNRTAPVYLLETPVRGETMTRIVSLVKKASLFYRSFNPSEQPRLSALDAISNVASSHGVIAPLLGQSIRDSKVHNLRAAFIAGLGFGLEIPTLLLQDKHDPLPPLDVRDFVKNYTHPTDIAEHIHDLSLSVVESIQASTPVTVPTENLLASLAMGDPMAENEMRDLAQYYLQTHEFNRAIRGDINLVVGRKGTGKTALFSQVRNKKRGFRSNVVVDLKPEGYQLIKLKENVLDFLSSGAKHHLVTAFWEYLLYLEITNTVLRSDKDKHLRDHKLFEKYRGLSEAYQESPYVKKGDFSERLLMLSASITDDFLAKYSKESNTTLTSDEVTSLIHSHSIRKLRELLVDYLDGKSEIWVLFDNLDKGWSPHGLVAGDITILRCLIDAARQIEREMRRSDRDCHVLIFIRNDVYQLLMDDSPDFGKESKVSLDWSDPDILREMLRKRLVNNDLPESEDFFSLWNLICVSHYHGEETSKFLIDRSLMRPRYFLKLFNECRGYAINLQHDKIEEIDIEKGLQTFSNDLLIDADQELTDIEPKAKGIIYQFLGEESEFSHSDLLILFDVNELSEKEAQTIIEFLIYYGFIGVKYLDDEPHYIFDREIGYNMQLMKTRMQKNQKAIRYVLNPAFWSALEISE